MDVGEIKSLEDTHTMIVRDEFRKARTHLRSVDASADQPLHKKRATSSRLGQRARDASGDVAQWREQHGTIEADVDPPNSGVDHEMQDVSSIDSHVPPSPRRPNKRLSQDSGDEMELSPVERRRPASDLALPIELQPPLKPPMLLPDEEGSEKLNWPHLYKQRRKLEDNWAKGRSTNFQLPHPLYPQEAHKECVYTIQFFGKWLVSGSRDKTLRIWDLDTRRLRGHPLVGHTQSVLCLQFDPTEDEDVVISGSSDTDVIVWRFSTGQQIHKIPQAHRESVLNLRFDHRYLVTCSKDKLIKVWNRHELMPTDAAYPKYNQKSQAKLPAHFIDTSSMSPSLLEAKISSRQIKPLRPYQLIMVLDGHAAAVNAIQIDGDLIVSASGDRFIKIWRLSDGMLLRTLQGHQKGIACVQSDSKRIVSGSSDNTVRIYDHETGAEVAVLHGHTNLVRTVQAGFGDLPGTDADLLEQAKAAETAYEEGVRTGVIIEPERARRAGARRGALVNGNRIQAFGANLPPGGGGSHWGRIVSGSYDETIIIWKKDADGRWIVGHTLRQEAAVRNSAAADLRAYHEGRIDAGGAPASAVQAMTAGTAALANTNVPTPSQIVQQTMQTSMGSLQAGMQNVLNIHNALGAAVNPAANLPRPPWMGPGAQQAMHQLQSHAQNVMQAHITQAANRPPNPANGQAGPATAQQVQHLHHHPTLQQNAQNQINQNNQQVQPQQQQQPQQQGHVQNAAANQNAQVVAQQSVSRVFKLQFDARRIVCCSQDPRIVGWDFADGDEDIIEAAKFFVGP